MLRFVQVNTAENIKVVKAGEALTRGAVVVPDYTDNTVDKATAGKGLYFVEANPNFNGLLASVPVNDECFEAIKAGEICGLVHPDLGERFATTELTKGSLAVGDPVVASAGKFVAAESNAEYEFVYAGEFADPTGKAMYIVEKVALAKKA